MESRNIILKELREISPVVAEISHQPPYAVPAGYFEGLADQLLQLARAAANSPVLPQSINPYQVPEGYFEGFANVMLQRVKEEEITLSPALQTANNNPYQAPEGYFEGFANTMLQRVKEEEISLSPALQAANNNPYQAPEGYFEGFANTMLQRVKEEEISLSPALQAANNNPYQTPDGYFEGFANTMLQRVKEEEIRFKASATDNANDELELLSPLLSQIGKQMPFSTPAGYFDELGENAAAGAQAIEFVNGELENLSPLMKGLNRIQVYEVPAGYFEQLPGQVLKAVKAQQTSKVVAMSFPRRVLRYAAAAIVGGLILTAGLLYLNNSNKTSDKAGRAVAAQLDNISEEMLENYLENQPPAPSETVIAATIAADEMDASDMKDMLADVTDEDLQQYLEKYSTVKDIQTN
ncbi:hypothetical protein [Longitalea arenae]|uniref:hypothetical protein n=1 Tax=Longitalea arenae TaxID=2812558 RepID=UPI001966D734|nr:hypothetical protein [Longitalea arenae]